jgi:hypothetical protein
MVPPSLGSWRSHKTSICRAGGVTQVVERLPSKDEPLRSNLFQYHQKKEKRKTLHLLGLTHFFEDFFFFSFWNL